MLKFALLATIVAISSMLVDADPAHAQCGVAAVRSAAVVQPVVQTNVRRGLFGRTIVRSRVRNQVVAQPFVQHQIVQPVVAHQRFVQPVVVHPQRFRVQSFAAPVVVQQSGCASGNCALFFSH